MVNTKLYTEGEIVNVEMVANSPTKKLVILGEGEIKQYTYREGTAEEETKTELRIPVSIDGKQKTWRPNKQTVSTLNDAFGEDTAAWVNKIVSLEVKTQGTLTFVVGKPFVDKTAKPVKFEDAKK